MDEQAFEYFVRQNTANICMYVLIAYIGMYVITRTTFIPNKFVFTHDLRSG
jgi:hypothetical protein